jgi:tripartite-type tricarboxylate transporter receptor subunit TctC
MLSAARQGLMALLCAASATWATAAMAANYPERPITMIVPAGVGGTNDAVARLVAQKLGEVLQGTVVVENRPGAGGNIGTNLAAKAQPDGYTLVMNISSTMAINPALYKAPGFDPVKDFVPISLVGSVPNVLVVSPSFPAKSLKELIDAAKAKPKAYQFGSAGNGTLPHLMGEMLNSYAGIEVQHIPYRAIAAALTDVIGGEISMAFATPAAVIQHIKSNRLVPLGVSSAGRTPSLPDVPAINEVLPGFGGTLWIALFAPQGLPAEIDQQLQAASKQALDSPDLRDKLTAQGVEIANGSPQQLAELLKEDMTRWDKIVKQSGAKVD